MDTPQRPSARITPYVLWLLLATAAGFGVSIWAAKSVAESERQKAQLRFDRLADKLVSELTRRTKLVLYGLKGARGIYAANQQVTRQQFAAYVASRDMSTEFPGTLGFGYIEPVQRKDLDSFLEATRRDGAPHFALRNSGSDDQLFIIKYIYPEEPNQAAQGFDVGSEAVRREAVLRAIETGKPTLTGRVTLVQDTAKRSGFLYVLPLFEKDQIVARESSARKQDSLIGLLYAPILIEEMMKEIGKTTDEMLAIEVYDGDSLSQETLLYDTDSIPMHTLYSPTTGLFGRSLHHRRDTLEIGERKWTYLITSNSLFDQANRSLLPEFVGLGGVVITLLAAWIGFALSSSRRRAVQLAEAMTLSLREKEAEARRLALVASRTSNGVIVAGIDQKIEWVNDGFTRLTGYTAEEVKGLSPSKLVQGPGTSPETKAIMRRGITSGEGFCVDVINYRKSGEAYWVNIEVRPLFDADGRHSGFMAIETDITPRKQAELHLQTERRRLRELADHAPGVLFQMEVSAEGIFSVPLLSLGFRDLFGLDPARFERQPLLLVGLLLRKERRFVRNRLLRAVASAKPWNDLFQVRVHHGDVHTVSVRSSILARADGTKVWFGALTDVTEHERARKAAESATAAKSQFLAMMSHEIRTPMNGVIGMTSLLLETPLSVQQRDYVNIIRASGDSLLKVINDILDFSKIESGSLDLEKEVFRLEECVESALDLFALRAAQKGIELPYEIAQTAPTQVRGDDTRLRQILVNLIGNALKFTEHGEIETRVSVQEVSGKQLLQFSIRDTGIGIPEEAKSRLFRSFSQVDAATTRKFGGSGLGLAISKRLVEIMGGSIGFESRLGEGTTFHFTVDLEWMGPTAQTTAAERPTKLKGLRLLLIQANDSSRRILTSLAQRQGVAVTQVESSAALQPHLHFSDSFDCVVMDRQMIGMDVLALARSLRERWGTGTPFILLNPLGQPLVPADQDLFVQVLSKPVKPARLFEAIADRFSAQANQLPTAPAVILSESPRKALRILLAEDNSVNQQVTLHMLDRLGYRADIAGNGLEAIAAVERQDYDLILMDVQMPEMDGLEATQAILEGCRRTRRFAPWIIALTADAMDGDREKCRKAGMLDYITKPLDGQELAAALQRAKPEGHVN